MRDRAPSAEPSASGLTHRVTVVAYEGLAPFELGVAAEVFALPRPELEVDWWYEFSVCAERPPA